MKNKGIFKKLTPKVLVLSLLLGGLASIGGMHYAKEKRPTTHESSSPHHFSNTYLKSSKLKNFFTKLQKNPSQKDELFEQLGPLTTDELNQGYLTAVSSFQYDLAIDYYNLGATECYNEGADILLISIYSGNLQLVEDLLTPKYPLKLYHLNAVRSLVNIDQANWAYIYKKKDADDAGYQKYQLRSQKIASEVISHYKVQNPIKSMEYDSSAKHEENYTALYGENCHERFHEQVQETLSGKYRIERSEHGTQRTPILVSENGKRIGIVKSKNELLAEALDYEHFAGVPPAISVKIPDMGSVILQKWVPDSTMAMEYKREKNWNQEQLHHIRVLDIRLGNSDRNRGNVLIAEQKGQKYIVPIDHDLIMHYIPNDNNWEAPYLNAPFSPLSKQYIEQLDLEKDAQVMRDLDYKNDDILSMKIRTTLLKMALEQNLTLKETDMLFRFYYFDFLEKVEGLSADSTEEEYRAALEPQMGQVSSIVQNPVQVWGLIGNNFELYI